MEIRVFLCTAFRDMQAERNFLHSVVFPRVQQRYQEAGHSLEVVDPRLHAASEEEAEGLPTLEKALDDVESCRPHFLCLLGNNYGKVILEVPDAIGRKHPAVRHFFRISRVHLETLTAVIREPHRAEHGFFYFRKPEFLNDVPEYDKPNYLPNNKLEALNEVEAHKLEIFKEAIQRTGRPVRTYGCTYDSSTSSVTGLDDLGAKIENDLLVIVGLAAPLAVEDTVPGSMVTEDAAGIVAVAGVAAVGAAAAGAVVAAHAMHDAPIPLADAPAMPVEEPAVMDEPAIMDEPAVMDEPVEETAAASRANVSLLNESQLDESAASLEVAGAVPDLEGGGGSFSNEADIDQILAEVEGATEQQDIVSGDETIISDPSAGEMSASEEAVVDELLSDDVPSLDSAEAAALEVFGGSGDDQITPFNPDAPSFEVAPEALADGGGSSFDFSDGAAPEPVEVVEEEETPKKKKKKKKK